MSDDTVWILEQDDICGGRILLGVFSSADTMLAWVTLNFKAPVSILCAIHKIVDRPEDIFSVQHFVTVDGVVRLEGS